MRRHPIAWVCVCFLFLRTSLCPAQVPDGAGGFGHMRYTTPHGWTERRYTAGVILSLDAPPADEQIDIQLMQPARAAGPLADAMPGAWDDACAALGVAKIVGARNLPYDAGDVRRSYKGWDYLHATGTVLANANQRQYFVDLYVLKINDRLERLFAISLVRNHNGNRLSLYDSPVHRRTFQEFVFAMRFDDFKDAAVAPATLKGDGIVGVWQGISMFGGKFKGAYAIFYSNGQVFFGSRFPLNGCGEQNTFLEAELTPRYWGTYRFEHGAGVIQMPFGEIPLHAKEAALTLTTSGTDHAFVRVPSVDGARFHGTYVMAEAYETIPVITFSADGQFRDEGAIRVLEHDFTNPFTVVAAPGTGTYAVRDHTITFHYADGRVYRMAYPGTDHDKRNPSPATLTLGYNEDPLTKR